MSETPTSTSSAEARRAQEAALRSANHRELFTRFRQVLLVGAVLWPVFALADLLALNTFGRARAPITLLGPRFFFAFIDPEDLPHDGSPLRGTTMWVLEQLP